MSPAVDPIPDQKIDDGETGERYKLRPDLSYTRLKNQNLLQGFNAMVGRHQSRNREIIASKRKERGAVYWKHAPGEKHEKEKWKIPDNQHLIDRFGYSGENKAESDD